MDFITIFYAQLLNESFNEYKMQEHLQTLPENICSDILTYKNKDEQRLRLGGKLLLTKMLEHFNLNNLSLNDIQKSGNNKPYFPSSDFQFNLSHSGNICICASAMHTNIGVDIEKIKPLNTTQLLDYLTEKEQKYLSKNAASSTDTFYKIWTKKEAVSKASGNLLDNSILQKTETANEPVMLAGKAFYTQHIYPEDGYIACVAADKKIKPESIVVKKIDL